MRYTIHPKLVLGFLFRSIMNLRPSKFYVLIALIVCSCNAQKKKKTLNNDLKLISQNWFDGEALLNRVKILASDEFEGRKTASNGAKKAKSFIIQELKKLNAQPLAPNFVQPFEFKSGNKTYNSENILCLIKGSQYPKKHIVISAHYDHEGIKKGEIYNGADDDASGVSALIAFVEYFKTHPPKHSVIIAAVDAEELGLKGSKYYVDHPMVPIESIVLNLNMDMIGRSDASELYVVGTNHYKQLLPAIPSNNLGLNIVTGQHDGYGKGSDWTNSSDHAPFHAKGIPFLYFGVEDHKDYHQPTDDFEFIQPIFYKNAVYTIISTFNTLDNMAL